MTGVDDFRAIGIDGVDHSLGQYAGQVRLIVNTASQCGLTPQYRGLQELQDRFADRGFTVLGFPCDQFGHQEPGTEDEIAQFCESGYGVTFPLFAKIEVNGPGAHPLFTWLKSEKAGILGSEAIKWNFTKFLIAADGTPVRRYPPTTEPTAIAAAIEDLLPA